MSDAPVETSVSITVDGKAVEARKGELVIDAAERNARLYTEPGDPGRYFYA